ncbi:MATE family efflux transporter [Millionella massiliensis]|uniref:MATE family efflux transporter n=1 Tax=Millionella massiliensis TaxID=1871023 RepID=UPI0024B660F9|nr:MATE family efflux transporter [Millionella massiliensis]
MNRKILALAIPNIVSNITIPLLGMVDLAIVGRLGNDALIGGIAVGGTIFNFLYWNFSFLRMGTSGFTAQAYGARNFDEAARVLVRALSVAVAVALVIWALQLLVVRLAMGVMEGSEAVEQAASRYFLVRVWAAPATLSLYAFTGWFIGMQNSRTPMWISIGINVVNIGCSLAAVRLFGMGIEGVALGTVIAQWSGVALALLIIRRYYGRFFRRDTFRHSGVLSWPVMRRFFKVNSDIFLRTLCLVAVFTYFTIASTRMGDTLLAVNTLMLELFTLFSYMMDGFAYAGEALAGRYCGAGNTPMLHRAVRGLLRWGVVVMLFFTLLYAVAGEQILRIFTSSEAILDAARDYAVWAVLVPVCSFLAFILDGIVVGITATWIMRNAMFCATIVFFAVYAVLMPLLGNAGLWIAFLAYLLMRGVVQLALSKHRILG